MTRSKSRVKVSIALLFAIAVSACGSPSGDSSSANEQAAGSGQPASGAEGTLLGAFLDPEYRDRPMARMWFPDAGAGLDEFDTIGKQISALAEGGFGGVEVTMLADGADFTNEQARIVGWGTEAWRSLLKKVLRAAEAVPGGFTVDITITPHWPMIISGVDPNDAAAAQEVSHTVQKLDADAMRDGRVRLQLPRTRLEDETRSVPAAPFIFTDTLESAVLLKVAEVAADGSPRYELASAIDLTSASSAIEGEGHAAGVPDAAAAEQYGFDYNEVLELWGSEPDAGADLGAGYNGKVDAAGNRARMQDWQAVYEADLSNVAAQLGGYQPSAGDELRPGDYAIVNVYRRGTGQVLSDGGFGGISVLMYGRTYTTDYFSRPGVDAVTYFWERNIIDDELRSLLEANRSSIFEDSIEASFSTAFWTDELTETLGSRGYRYTAELPVVVALGAQAFTDTRLASRIRTDYNNTLGSLYETEHLRPISDWAGSFGYSYRAQARGVTGVDQYSSATIVDIPEGDNGTKGDGIRQLAGAARMSNKAYVSMEAVTGFGNLKLNWADVLTEVTQNFSHGVNHVVLHGTPYNKAWNGYMSDWTGWQAFGNNFAGSYTYRQIYWDDATTMGNYMARNQAVLRNGIVKADLVVIGNGSGNSFQNLLDKGYSYHLASEAMLQLETAIASNGRLYEQGPAYKAVIVVGDVADGAAGPGGGGPAGGPGGPGAEGPPGGPPGGPGAAEPAGEAAGPGPGGGDQAPDAGAPPGNFGAPDNVAASFEPEPQRTYSVASVRKLRALAEAGLPVILVNLAPTAVAGTESGENTDATLVAELAQLKAADNVVEVTTRDEVAGALRELSVTPYANYDQAELEATHYVDAAGGSNYYYLYYNPNPRNSGMINVAESDRYKSAAPILAEVTLAGSGVPYRLDAWTGEVRPIADYRIDDDDRITLSVGLHGGESAIVALLADDPGVATAAPIDLTTGVTAANPELPALDLGLAEWDLELHSYGPDDSEANVQDSIVPEFETPYIIYRDPSASTITTVQFDGIELGNWSDLPATDAQLDALGVDSMANVSGIGYYTTRFELPADWNEGASAILELGYSQDEVTQITINGQTLDRINVIADNVDLTGRLQPGQNVLTIKLVTGLFNRAVVESMVFDLPGPQVNGNTPVEYGLKSVRLVPLPVGEL